MSEIDKLRQEAEELRSKIRVSGIAWVEGTGHNPELVLSLFSGCGGNDKTFVHPTLHLCRSFCVGCGVCDMESTCTHALVLNWLVVNSVVGAVLCPFCV